VVLLWVGCEERGASGKDRAGDEGVSQRDSVQEIRVANKEQIELLMRRKRAAALKTPLTAFPHCHGHHRVTSFNSFSDECPLHVSLSSSLSICLPRLVGYLLGDLKGHKPK